MNDQAPLYIVITDFDGWTQTRECLLRLYRSSYKSIVAVVVDHGLTDETARGLNEFPQCIRIAASSELWWSGATNLGIQFALNHRAQRVMLLNNDCFVNEDTIALLVQHCDSKPEMVIAPRQYNSHDGRLVGGNVTTCFALGFVTVELPAWLAPKNIGPNLASTTMIVGGRGVIIPSRIFEDLGLFDESELPHYGADHDFYLRCTANNIRLAVATNAAVSLDETKTTVSRNLGQLTVRDFINTFSDPRSHRNLQVLKTLFKRYFLFPNLYLLGVLLNITRYSLIYFVRRVIYSVRHINAEKS